MAIGLLLSMSLTMIWMKTPYARQYGNSDFFHRICGNVQVRNVSNYFQHYSKITDFMQEEMTRNKFAFKDEGDPPDRLYVLSQCMDDLSGLECDLCFTQIGSLIPSCFPNTGGRVYFDGCFIRADNYSFYREVLSPQDSTKCGGNESSRSEFGDAVKSVLYEMLQSAPTRGPDWRGFAAQKATILGATAYGMASCWKILDQDFCQACLSHAVTSALSCLPSTQARVLNAGCFLRYADFAFTKESSFENREEAYSYVAFFMGTAMVSLLAISVGLWLGKHTYQRKNIKNLKGMEDLQLLDEGLHFLQFKHSIIQKATENFNETHKLGGGRFGTLPDGREIAVKHLYVNNKSRIQEICNEMDIISRAQHKNLVRFLGCCFTSAECFLVYEYLANKSLDLILFDQEKKKELAWEKRLLIITGTAEGLEYLHSDCQVRIIHRDIKASNVLLDLRYKPKISDFGLARFHSCDHFLLNTAIAGTFGYVAPEYVNSGRLTEKIDVYSFGVLVIEVVTGLENTGCESENSFENLIDHAWKHFRSNTVHEIIDKSMEIENIEEVKRVVQIGLLCTQELPKLRPTMARVVQMLRKKDLELPEPSNPPLIDEHIEDAYQRRQLSDYQQTHNHRRIFISQRLSMDFDQMRKQRQSMCHRRHSSAEHHELIQVMEVPRRISSEFPRLKRNSAQE